LKNSPSSFSVPLDTGAVSALVYRSEPHPGSATIVLAHGAGAGQQSGFMISFARALSARGVDVVTFNFPYIERQRRIPDRGPVLEACYRSVIASVPGEVPSAHDALFIGGKSMGGRIATQAAAADPDLPIAGIVLLGYPLHPPGRLDQLRDKHLPSVKRPMLFVQGTRDAFGTPSELTPILDGLTPRPTLHPIEGGDHSFKISRKDPSAQEGVYATVQDAIVAWMQTITASAPAGRRPR
jgi:predicted alpha/beta-hydrolase family hydrolase